jgi:Cu/Ag efflux pump CusA
MAISIVLAVMASLMVALMVVPALSTYLFTKGVEHKSTRALDFIDNSYKKIILYDTHPIWNNLKFNIFHPPVLFYREDIFSFPLEV